MVQADFGKQPLEPKSAFRRGTTTSLIFVDNFNPIPRPAEVNGSADQRVLAFRGFGVFENLVRTRLTNVDDRCSI
jgi:hypothetical protein